MLNTGLVETSKELLTPISASLESGSLAFKQSTESTQKTEFLDAKVAVDVIAQLRKNMETLEDLQGRLSFILKEVSEVIDHRRR